MKLQEFFLELEESGRCRLSLKEEFSYGTDKADDISHSYQVAELMNSVFHLGNKAEEYVYLIAVNIQTRILGIFELSHGNMEMSTVMPREIFTRILLCGAHGFFLVHNHPSQVVKPSNADAEVTKRIEEASKIVGLHFLDHIILAKDSFYSFFDDNKIK